MPVKERMNLSNFPDAYFSPPIDIGNIQEKKVNLNIKMRPEGKTRGVYFLFDGEECVYVGRSVEVKTRIKKHIREGEKEFDGYAIMRCSKMKVLEAACMQLIEPKYNSFKSSTFRKQFSIEDVPVIKKHLGEGAVDRLAALHNDPEWKQKQRHNIRSDF